MIIPQFLLAQQLELKMEPDKYVHRISDGQIKFFVSLRNSGSTPVYVEDLMVNANGGNIKIVVEDSSGKRLQSRELADAIMRSVGQDPNEHLIRLQPEYSWGTDFDIAFASREGFNRPGKYRVYAIYKSSTPKSEIAKKPFWGSEQNDLKSNVLDIRITK